MKKEKYTCFKAIPCSSCSECANCTLSKISESEINRCLRHNPEFTRESIEAKFIEWWLPLHPFISYVSKYQNAGDFMENIYHVLSKADINMMPYVQNYNYYKKFWGDAETCQQFIKAAIKTVEFLGKNVGISQNDNEVIIVLKDFA